MKINTLYVIIQKKNQERTEKGLLSILKKLSEHVHHLDTCLLGQPCLDPLNECCFVVGLVWRVWWLGRDRVSHNSFKWSLVGLHFFRAHSSTQAATYGQEKKSIKKYSFRSSSVSSANILPSNLDAVIADKNCSRGRKGFGRRAFISCSDCHWLHILQALCILDMKDSHYATNFTPFVLAARSKTAFLFLAW